MSASQPITVLYIAGSPRSGSTILSQVLGELPGITAVGELAANIWTYGFRDNLDCSCRQKFCECVFWKAVIEEAFSGADKIDVDQMLTASSRVARYYWLPLVYARIRPRSFEQHLQLYFDYLRRIYSAVAKVSGTQIILDSSKSPTRAFLIEAMTGIDLRVIHLVRDSRAVAFSQARRKVRPEFGGARVLMDRQGYLTTAAKWNSQNLLADLLSWRLHERYVRIRYKDFVESPKGTVDQVLTNFKLTTENAHPFPNPQSVNLSISHQVSGNPIRFNAGTVPLKLDDEWQAGLTGPSRTMITALTWFLLKRYKYT